MPFAGYSNFAACIRANRGKKNPNAYCGSIMHAIEGKDYDMQEDTRIRDYGDTNYEDKVIRINPARGDVVNTVIHEKLHSQYPDMPHEEIYRKAYEIESNMGIKEMGDLLHETAREVDKSQHLTRTTASKVVRTNVK